MDFPNLASEGVEQQRFNFGIEMTMVLRSFLTNLEIAFMNWDLRSAIEILGAIFNECEYVFEDEDFKKRKEIFEEINNLTINYPHTVDSNDEAISPKEIRINLRNLLIEYDLLLRRVIHKSGMGMPKQGEENLF